MFLLREYRKYRIETLYTFFVPCGCAPQRFSVTDDHRIRSRDDPLCTPLPYPCVKRTDALERQNNSPAKDLRPQGMPPPQERGHDGFDIGKKRSAPKDDSLTFPQCREGFPPWREKRSQAEGKPRQFRIPHLS